MIVVREETASDIPAIRRLNEEPLGQPTEADIIDRLRASCDRLLSLVAVLGKRIVGHILFSPVVLESEGRLRNGMGLGPIAVLPSLQRREIGSRLVKAELARMRSAGCPFVVVPGHHGYFPRFDFKRVSDYGVGRESWDAVSDEAFMTLVSEEKAIPAGGSVARYREGFNEAI